MWGRLVDPDSNSLRYIKYIFVPNICNRVSYFLIFISFLLFEFLIYVDLNKLHEFNYGCFCGLNTFKTRNFY